MKTILLLTGMLFLNACAEAVRANHMCRSAHKTYCMSKAGSTYECYTCDSYGRTP